MTRALTILLWVFAVLYVAALALFLIGTYGWFGQEQDPLAGVFLLPLGLPWNLMTGALPEAPRLWAALLAPVLNIVLLVALRGWFARRR
ncbi:hypothetical protein [Vannielia litorea]|uniref:hypothetical protein n=1 Tax=Vannielia litorea TaxID=1217970 RepID=UPI001BCD8B6E|nr:hypothetical protein [Vannielia litorea]MBS8228712.1 hypothetical protein [Vannielia litorea]